MMNRVSSRLRDSGTPLVSSSSKCFTQTLPVGNNQLPFALNCIVRFVFGIENQRVLIAPSDQNGTFRSCGSIPGFGSSVVKSLNAPVSASVAGNGAPVWVAL